MKNNILEVENLSIRYRESGLMVLKDLSFEVKKGEVVAILGPSGCGKTTLLNAISRLLDQKEAEINGKIYFNTNDEVRTVFQDPRLLPWRTAIGNVAFGLEVKGGMKEETDKRARGMLEAVGLSEFADYYPDSLSIGMKQRVNFARAAACKPELLLLDEPFSALDIKTKKKLENQFLSLIMKENITTVFVTHNFSEAIELADRVIVLRGRPATIKGIYKKEDFKKISSKASEIYR